MAELTGPTACLTLFGPGGGQSQTPREEYKKCVMLL